MGLTEKIINLFRDYMREQGISITQMDEEAFPELGEKIEELMKDYPCRINTSMGGADGVLTLKNGSVDVSSEQLDDYLEEYSME